MEVNIQEELHGEQCCCGKNIAGYVAHSDGGKTIAIIVYFDNNANNWK
jgi:hypothetical protein